MHSFTSLGQGEVGLIKAAYVLSRDATRRLMNGIDSTIKRTSTRLTSGSMTSISLGS